METPDRIHLAQLPTPLHHAPRLSEVWGADIWIKRDDLTGFGLSGNKVRKLEYHMKAAQDAGATTVRAGRNNRTTHGPQRSQQQGWAFAPSSI